MKYPLLFFITLFCYTGFGQVTIEIKPSDTIICFRDSIAFESLITGSFTGTLAYQWQKNSGNINGATDSIYSIPVAKEADTGFYRCILFLNGVVADTSNTSRVRMHPPMKIDLLKRMNPLGCHDECKGQFNAYISGGTRFTASPYYIYEWGGGKSQDTAVFGLCPNTYTFKVTDSMGCVRDTNYLVDYLKSPKILIKFSPRDTVYLTNPTVVISFADSMRSKIMNWTWEFGDSAKAVNINPVTHIYDGSGEKKVKLKYTDLNGCDTVMQKTLTVKVAELEIFNVFTPNGDLKNDRFEIRLKGEAKTRDYREAWLSNEFEVFDRWGRRVYHQENYKSEDWDGDHLSDGVYYYILKCQSQWGTDVFRGSVTILTVIK